MKTKTIQLLFNKEELAQLISAMKAGNIHPQIHTIFIESWDSEAEEYNVCFCLKGDHTTAQALQITADVCKKVFSN